MAERFEPGMLVRHPSQPEWGQGQVQSVIGHRITVNFEETGKVVVDSRIVSLEWIVPSRIASAERQG